MVSELDLFDPPPAPEPIAVAKRDVRIDPPIAPGSESSRRGAASAKPKSNTQMEGILAVLARVPDCQCLSRDEIIARYGPQLSTPAACGRLKTLEQLNYVDVVESGAVSNAGIRVNGYKLSALGRGRVQTRRAS